MNKEHLKKIKVRFLSVGDGDINWLIEYAEEQAERVEELEEFKRGAEKLYEYAHLSAKKSIEEKEALRKQNKRYREALEFYGNKDNYKLEHFDPNLDDYMSTVDYDEGTKARKALEETP